MITLVDRIKYAFRKVFPKNGYVDNSIISNTALASYATYSADETFKQFSKNKYITFKNLKQEEMKLHPLDFYGYTKRNSDIVDLGIYTKTNKLIQKEFKLYKRSLKN